MLQAQQGLPFEATCTDAPTGLVGQITVEVYDPTDSSTIVAPTTAGITEPREGSYDATLTVDPPGTFIVRWTLPDGLTAEEDLVVTPTAVAPSMTPTVADLAALMRARTQGELAYQGTFNAETLPTDVQAAEMIGVAASLVGAKVGASVPNSLATAAAKAILFKAAALVEVTYYPEQANDDASAYSLYQAQYEELLAVLVSALDDNRPNAVRWGSIPTVGREGYVPVPPVA